MENNKKRRSSILKKKTTDEETTTEIKARRISFSGKKSVKEFIAGEEAATIWGTSYEESADDLQLNSTERSGLINVNEKRIELRNRRVVIDQPKQKRRSSLKKKVLIAENDKENICVKETPQPVVNISEEKPPSPSPSVQIKTPKPESPVKSELALIKYDDVLKIRESMPSNKPVPDPVSICSSTFDFINFSGQINKTINIEQSLDVTLSDFELKMYKFRLPVSTTDQSPNLSDNSKMNGSPPNIFSQSILMTGDELKLVREQKKVVMSAKKIKISDKLETEKDTQQIVRCEEKLKEMQKADASQAMEITQIFDEKVSKRKSERTTQYLGQDSILVDTDSPIRKKPMHVYNISTMDVTNNEVEPTRRPSIHFDSVAVEESTTGMHSINRTNASSYTILDNKTINGSTTYLNSTESCLAMGNQKENISMELSMCANNEPQSCPEIAPRVQYGRQNNYHLEDQMEYSINGQQPTTNDDCLKDKTIKSSIDIFEDSIKTKSPPKPISKIRQTIYESTDIEEVEKSSNHEAGFPKSKNQRKSNYNPVDMAEELPIQSQTAQTQIEQSSQTSKGLTLRQTIFSNIEVQNTIKIHSSESCPSMGNQKHNLSMELSMCANNEPQSGPEIPPIVKSSTQNNYHLEHQMEYSIKGQQPANNDDCLKDKTNKSPIDIFDCSIKTISPSKPISKIRQTIYDSTDIEEVEKPSNYEARFPKSKNQRKSNYNPIDMTEESPIHSQTAQVQEDQRSQTSKGQKHRQTIFSPENIIEPNIELQNTIKTPFSIFEDSIKTEPVSKTVVKGRKTVYDSADIEEDASSRHPLGVISVKNKPRESIYTHNDMVEDSLKPIQPYDSHKEKPTTSTSGLKTRPTIHKPEDIAEDSPQKVQTRNICKDILKKTLQADQTFKSAKNTGQTFYNSVNIDESSVFIQNASICNATNPRKSVYSPRDMVEDSLKPMEAPRTAANSIQIRRTILAPKDIDADPPKQMESKNTLQKTITYPIDIYEDSRQTAETPKPTVKSRQTIYESNDIEEETVQIPQAIIGDFRNVYSADDIEESPKQTQPLNRHEEHSIKTSSASKHVELEQTIFDPEYTIAPNDMESTSELQPTNKIPFDIYEDSFQVEKVSNPIAKCRQSIHDPVDIEENTTPIQEANVFSNRHNPRQSVYTHTDMIEELPKLTQSENIQKTNALKEPNTSKRGLKIRRTIFTEEDIAVDSQQKDTRYIQEENILPHSNDSRKSIHTHSDMIVELPKPIQLKNNEDIAYSQKEKSSKSGLKVRRTILTRKDIVVDQPQGGQSKKTIKTSSGILTDSPELGPASKSYVKIGQTINNAFDIEDSSMDIQQVIPNFNVKQTEDILDDLPNEMENNNTHKTIGKTRHTVYDPNDIEDETIPTVSKSIQHEIVFNRHKARETIYSPSAMIEDSPKSRCQTSQVPNSMSLSKSSSEAFKLRPSMLTSEDIVIDLQRKIEPTNTFQNITTTTLTTVTKTRHTIYDSKDVEYENYQTALGSIQQGIINNRNKARQTIYSPSGMTDDSPNSTHVPICTSKPKSGSDGLTLRRTILAPEDINHDLPRDIERKNTFQNKSNSIPATTTSNTIARSRHTICDSEDIEDENDRTASASTQQGIPFNRNKARQTIYSPSGMIEDSPKSTQVSMCTSKSKSSDGFKVRPTILAPEDTNQNLPKDISSKNTFQNKSNSIPATTASRTIARSRHTIYDFKDIEDETEQTVSASVQQEISSNKKMMRQSVYTPANMEEDSPKQTQHRNAQETHSFRTSNTCKDLVLEQNSTKLFNTLHTAQKTVFNDFEDSIQIDPVSNTIVKPRQTIYDFADVEEDIMPIQKTHASPTNNDPRKSVYIHSDMIEESPKSAPTSNFTKATKTSACDQKVRRTILTPKDIEEDLPQEKSRNLHKMTKTGVVESTIHIERTTIPSAKIHQTINPPEDIEIEPFPPPNQRDIPKSQKSRESIYLASDIIEDSPKPLKAPKTLSNALNAHHTVLTSEDIVDEFTKEIGSKIKTKTPVNVFQDSLQTSSAPKPIGKNRQTVYDCADIEEERVPFKHTDTNESSQLVSRAIVKNRKTIYNSVDMEDDSAPSREKPASSKSNKSKKSPSDMQEESPKTEDGYQLIPAILIPKGFNENNPNEMGTRQNTQEIPENLIQAKNKTGANTKGRRTIYHNTDIEEDELPFEQPNILLENKLPIQSVSACSISIISKPTPSYATQRRQTAYNSVDIEEETVPIQPDSNFLSKPNVKCRETVYNSVDIEAVNVFKHEIASNKNNKLRKSVYTSMDIVEDNSICQIQPSKENAFCRKTVYEGCDIMTDSPEVASSSNRKYQEIIRTQETSNEHSIRENNATKQSRCLLTDMNHVKPAEPERINANAAHKEFYMSAYCRVQQNAVPDDVSMELVSDEKIPKKQEQKTIYLNKDFEAENDSSIENNHKHVNSKEKYLMSKYHETPSKFTRSFVEYLRAEEAALLSDSAETNKTNEEEEIFYDAEDGNLDEIQDKQQPCRLSANVLEESGIQPIQMDAQRRQTTFSPKDIKDESVDHEQSSLAAIVTDNRMQKQSLDFPRKCLFQKSLQSVEMMELTRPNDDSANKKPILIKSLLDMHASKADFDVLSIQSSKKDEGKLDEQENSMSKGMDTDNLSKPLSSKQPFSRKTIHFANENAVDESFFDETISKPNVQRNRQTLFFNESIQTSDVSTTWNKPSSIQSVKEMLLENTRLFLQSNLLKPSAFVKQNSPKSMDVGLSDHECTPTKSKVSRIPQLIGSAKKLESLKKSMKFIQQELPNLGCHHPMEEDNAEGVQDSPKEYEQETPRRVSMSVPKKLQESFKHYDNNLKESSFKPKQLLSLFDPTAGSKKDVTSVPELPQKCVGILQESFDTIDIPRKVISHVRKTMEESSQREIERLEELLVDDEIPQMKTNAEQRALHETFDTVEIPRRGTTFQRNDTLFFCPNDMERTTNASRKSQFQFEDAPITVSDVSTFFAQKQLPTAEKYSPNTTETLCKLNVNEIQAPARSSDSEDATHNLAKFKKLYVELTCNSIEVSDVEDQIEKTHLSLINTLDDQSEMVSLPSKFITQAEIIAEIPVEIPVELPTKSSPAREHSYKKITSVCRKCKGHRLSVTQNETTIGSFMLEPLPVYKIDLNALQQLASKPKLSDVGNVWRQKIRESDSFNVSDGSRSVVLDDDDSVDIEGFLLNLENDRILNSQNRLKQQKEIKTETSFVQNVWKKMQGYSNWILNDLLLTNNVLRLTHTRLRTFAIFISLTPKDPRGIEVNFHEIQLVANRLHTRQWKPFEYALHYQLLVELPFDLKKICPTSDHLFEFLEYVDKVTQDVLRSGRQMLGLVLSSPALLIRDPSGSLYIRKYVRTKTPEHEIKHTEIHIEVRNIKKLSYESIVMPPLYEFHENIQLLPVGYDFLRIFLEDPLKFIKA